MSQQNKPPQASPPLQPSAAVQLPDVEITKEFLSHLRHELRTPVNAILGYSEMLLEDTEGGAHAGTADTLNELLALGKQILGVINDQLSSARFDSDEISLNPGELEALLHTHLGPLSEAVIASCDRLSENATGALEAFLPDIERIRNAGRALPDQIRTAFHGIHETALPVRGPEPRPTVEQHRHQESTAELETQPDVVTPGHILVVDDNKYNRDILARYLYREGHGFALARDGVEALEIIRAGDFDLVLLDVMMPNKNGFEVLEELKADASYRDLPVLMISAVDELDHVVRCIEMGAVDYLHKPFNPTLLRARVNTCLEKKRLRDRELDYLRNVETVTSAAAAVEGGTFQGEVLATVAQRHDPLGQLARVFQHMAEQVYLREQRLRQEVQQLRVEIDEARKARQVAEITETDYFQTLQLKAQQLRQRAGRDPHS